MLNTQLFSFLIIVGYLVALILIIYNKKKKESRAMESAESFFMANRGVNAVLLPLTMIAAMQSTFAFLGAPGMYYTHGISFMVLILSQVWVALMVIYFGNRIRVLANKYNYISIGEYLEDRFQSRYINILASIISVTMTMVFLSMQYVGNARAMQVVTGGLVPYNVAILIGVVFSLIYVSVGGAGGVVLIDAIQAVVLMIGIVIAAIIALGPVGGIESLFQKTMETAPELLSRPGPKGLYNNKYWIMQFIVLPFGIWFCPHIWARSLMAKDKKAIAMSAISIPVSQVLIYAFSTLFVGLAGHQLLGQVDAADNVLPMMMMQNSNWLIAAIIMAAAIAAGMSTINSMLLEISKIVSQDLVLYKKKNTVSGSENMRITRIIIVIVATISAAIALRPPATLVQVVQDVAYTGLAQIAPGFILSLYWPKVSKQGVAAGMTFGIVVLFALRILQMSPMGFPGFMWAFFGNIIITVLISMGNTDKDLRVEEKFFF
ncbi:MAG: sodium:solute symporter family protein [Tissierellia bacterium]|nr:sodium:solute symporter family protein [Tissierellia bacterium]